MAGGTSSQFLQVPKVLPFRKSRSRSRSRPREGQPEAVVVSSPPPPRVRPQSPPVHMPTTDLSRKSSLKGSLNRRVSTKELRTGRMNGHLPTTPAVQVVDTPMLDTGGTNYDDLNGEIGVVEQACTPPPPELTLRQKLVGAWKLESYIAYPTPGSPIQRPTHPMTKNVTGMIMYTPDGYMSAQMLIPGQKSFKRGEGEEPQWAEAAKRCFAYCGPYYISNEGPGREEVLRHTFQVVNLPGWLGDIQVRTHRFEENGEVLVLGSEEPSEIKGDKRIPVLKWRRARNNSDGTPPPPTPQIKISGPGEL